MFKFGDGTVVIGFSILGSCSRTYKSLSCHHRATLIFHDLPYCGNLVQVSSQRARIESRWDQGWVEGTRNSERVALLARSGQPGWKKDQAQYFMCGL